MLKSFASTRLAFFLITLLALLLLLSAIIPQRDIAEAQPIFWDDIGGDEYAFIQILRLDRIYYSPYFFIVLFLISVNLIIGNVRRFRSVLKIEKTLLKARHLGSIIFHFSLLLIMAGVILNYLYKSEGIYGLTEGQLVKDVAEDYRRQFSGPLHSEQFGRFSVTLDEVYTDYVVNEKETNAAEITIHSPSRIDSAIIVYANKPHEFEDFEFHFGPKVGYSPELLVADTSGNVIFRSFVRLSTREIEGEIEYVDFVLLEREMLKINVEALPHGTVLDSIKFEITVEKGTDVVYNGTLMLKDTIWFDSRSITIPRVRRWSYIVVLDSPFLGLVFFGFWSALGGMVIGFIPRVWPHRNRKE